MENYQTFITKSDQLERTLNLLRQKGIPDTLDEELLVSVGLNEPNSLFYIKLFKKLGLINAEGDPVPSYYKRFVESENEARLLIGELLPKMYAAIYEKDERAFKLTDEKLYDLFRKQMEGGKSVTFVRLVANTYRALALYADQGIPKEEPAGQPVLQENGVTNGHSLEQNGSINGHTETISLNEAKSPSDEFLIELMNDCSVHNYEERQARKEAKNGKDEEEEAAPSGIDMPSPSNTNDSAEIPVESSFPSPIGNKKADNSKSLLSKALVRRAELLERMQRPDEAAKAFSDIITYYRDKKYPLSVEHISNAFYKKGCLLEELGDYEQALKTYNEFIEVCGERRRSA